MVGRGDTQAANDSDLMVVGTLEGFVLDDAV